MKIFIVMPALNEEKNIGKVIRSAKKYGYKNVLVVDDGSTDDTAKIARELGAIVIKHKKNLGVAAALRTGFKEVLKYHPDIVVETCSDNQYDFSELRKLIEPIKNDGCDMVIGSRYLYGTKKMKMPFIRRLGNIFFSLLASIVAGRRFTDVNCGYRAYRREVIKMIKPRDVGYGNDIDFLLRANDLKFKIKEVPVYCRYEKYTSQMKLSLSWIQFFKPIVLFIYDKIRGKMKI